LAAFCVVAELNRRSLERRFRTSRLIFAVFYSNLLSTDRASNMHGSLKGHKETGAAHLAGFCLIADLNTAASRQRRT
jgi:hypothetical protein